MKRASKSRRGAKRRDAAAVACSAWLGRAARSLKLLFSHPEPLNHLHNLVPAERDTLLIQWRRRLVKPDLAVFRHETQLLGFSCHI